MLSKLGLKFQVSFAPAMMYGVAITGASGFVARNLRCLCAARNIPAVLISRSAVQRRALERVILTRNYHDISTSEWKCQSLIHLVGTGPRANGTEYSAANRATTRAVLDICKRTDTGHIVYLSGLGVGKAKTPYFDSKSCAEQEIKESGIDYTIFRPSYIIGDGDYLTKNLQRQIRSGEIIIPCSKETADSRLIIQPIRVRDAAKIILKTVNDERFSRRILDMVGTHRIPFAKFAGEFAGPSVKMKFIDTGDAYRLAESDSSFPYTVDDLDILTGDFVGDYRSMAEMSEAGSGP